MRLLLGLALLLVAVADYAAGARILAVLPMPARSHHHLFRAVLKTLAERGHEVVSYTAIPMDKPFPNYTEIHLDTVQAVEKTLSKEQLSGMMNMSPVRATLMMWDESTPLLKGAFEHKKIKELIKSNEHFDLVVLEALVAQETLLGFAHKFKAPSINIHPFGAFSPVNKVAGNSLSLSHIPDYSFPLSNHMTFYERFLNSYSILSTLFTYYTDYLPRKDIYTRSQFNDPEMPSVFDLIQNISLFINNAHPSVQYAQPQTPNMLSVGGIHLQKNPKPLPLEMKKFLDEAKHGVVYFSLGSVLPDHLLPEDHFEKFIKAFRRLPQRILWKTSSELKNLPDNVMVAKWVPQQDVLAHPKVVLFVTHGGLFSQHEAIHAGVPVVCIPFFGDQPMNAKFYEEKGVGVRLLFDSLSEETIYSAMTTVLNNPMYKENMQRLSLIYRDQPLSPADRVVFWTEYVLRHGGAPHLRPASAHMPWYQLALLDVAVAILTPVTLALAATYFLIKKLIRSFFGTNDKKHERNAVFIKNKKNL